MFSRVCLLLVKVWKGGLVRECGAHPLKLCMSGERICESVSNVVNVFEPVVKVCESVRPAACTCGVRA